MRALVHGQQTVGVGLEQQRQHPTTSISHSLSLSLYRCSFVRQAVARAVAHALGHHGQGGRDGLAPELLVLGRQPQQLQHHSRRVRVHIRVLIINSEAGR
jgi:hypothetical protein